MLKARLRRLREGHKVYCIADEQYIGTLINSRHAPEEELWGEPAIHVAATTSGIPLHNITLDLLLELRNRHGCDKHECGPTLNAARILDP